MSSMNRGPRDSMASETSTETRSTDELAARREKLGAPYAPTVLVVDTVAGRIASLKRWAADQSGLRLLFAETSAAATELATREQPEVAVIDLLFREGRSIALAVELARIAPEIEMLFIVDDGGAPEVQAAWDLGWNRLVASNALAGWMDRGLGPLAQLVSLKRQVASVRHDTERLCAGNVWSPRSRRCRWGWPSGATARRSSARSWRWPAGAARLPAWPGSPTPPSA